jgi:hypothetical protein
MIVTRVMANGKTVTAGGGAARKMIAAVEPQGATGMRLGVTRLENDTLELKGKRVVSAAGRRRTRSLGATAPAIAATDALQVDDADLPVSYSLNAKTASAPNIRITSGVPAGGAVAGAISQINQAAGQTLINPEVGSTTIRNAANDGTNIISFAQGNYRFNKRTIAVSISYITANRIAGTDILFNPKMTFSTDDSGAVERNSYDIQGLLTHEMMHGLGVNHVSDPQATMYPYVSRTDDVKLRTLEDQDKNALNALYPGPAL